MKRCEEVEIEVKTEAVCIAMNTAPARLPLDWNSAELTVKVFPDPGISHLPRRQVAGEWRGSYNLVC